MLDHRNRKLIMEALGGAVDSLVRELYSFPIDGRSIAQEPEITSRICQRVEDRLNGQLIGDYLFEVTAMSMPDRGAGSLEKLTGADLLLSLSLDGPDGFDKSIFIQAKYDRNLKRAELLDACERMQSRFGRNGSYVWIYEPNGVRVISPYQVRKMRGNTLHDVYRRSMAGFAGRILDCYAGSQDWSVPKDQNRRQVIRQRLHELWIPNALDLTVRRAKKQRR